MALDTSVEVLRVGKWSVRRLGSGGSSRALIYMHVPTGRAQDTPPPEVLEELDMGEMSRKLSGAQADEDPLFRRIVLGNGCEVPLTMARDILEALREDVALFESVQRKFSDFPKEPPLRLDELLKTLEMDSLTLDPGQVSDVIKSDIGVQILLRVS